MQIGMKLRCDFCQAYKVIYIREYLYNFITYCDIFIKLTDLVQESATRLWTELSSQSNDYYIK